MDETPPLRERDMHSISTIHVIKGLFNDQMTSWTGQISDEMVPFWGTVVFPILLCLEQFLDIQVIYIDR